MVAAACKVITKKKYFAGAWDDRAQAVLENQLDRKKIVEIFSGIFLSMIIVAFISFIIFMG